MIQRQNIPLDMKRGDTGVFLLQVKDTNGNPYNITGGKVYFTAKRSPVEPDSQAVSQLSSPASGVLITDALSGKSTARMPATATVAFPDTPVVLGYDAQLVEADGTVTTFQEGALTVEPDFTRAIS